MSRAVLGFERATAQDFAAGDVVVGCQPEPGAEMLLWRELAHISADLSEDGLSRTIVEPIDVDQVHPSNAKQFGTDIKLR